MKGQTGLYFHWPFCLSKCPYCDFNVHVRDRIDESQWRAAYIKSMESWAAKTKGRRISSIYFGGGTPSLMAPETVGAVIEAAARLWALDENAEITIEANPTSVETEKLRAFRDAGVNRVSMGVQALNDADLKFFGRTHGVAEALKAIDTARQVFDRFSFDLMYARPAQTLEAWERELRQAIALARGHLSLYQLTIERSTPFYFDHAQGRFNMPDDGLSADFYALTQEITAGEGLPAYEVSNHAAPGQESRHNMLYWRYGDYIGIGPGAHGRVTLADGKKYATRDHSAPEIWMERVQAGGDGMHPAESLTPRAQFEEALLAGLRTRNGIDFDTMSAIAGEDAMDRFDRERIGQLVRQGWAELSPDRLALSPEGWLRLDSIVPYILRP